MIAEEEIRKLLEVKSESPNLDYKEDLIWDKNHRDERLGVIKDILAMANTQDGGKIVFGVRDNDLEFVGVSEDSYESFDPTPVNELLHNYADPTFTCTVAKSEIDGKKVVVVDVPEFSEIPIICKSSANSTENVEVLKKGSVYRRTDKCTSESISTADEMRNILSIGLTKKSDELLGLIQRLISGKPLKEGLENINTYEEELEEANKFLESSLNSDVGFWEVVAYPTNYNPKLLPNPVEVGRIVEESVVHLRGWDFPHIDSHGKVSNFNKGKQSFTISEVVQVQEAWRMHKSGLFVWKEYLMEDLRGFDENDHKVLFFVSAIYLLTEITLFLKRVYADKLKVDTIHVKIVLNKCKDRQLVDGGSPLGLLHRDYVSKEDQVLFEMGIKTVDLKASFESVARVFIKEIFMIFNWNDPLEEMLQNWQKKLLEHGGL